MPDIILSSFGVSQQPYLEAAVASRESIPSLATPSSDSFRDPDRKYRVNGGRNGRRRIIPQTTSGILRAIMLSALIPFLLLQTAIYILWLNTRAETELNANTEIASSVAAAFASYVSDVHRQELVAGEAIRNLPADRAGKLLIYLKDQYSTVLRFSLVDAAGRIVASSDPNAVGQFVADKTYFQQIKSGQAWSLSNLSDAPMTDKKVFSISSRVETRDKQLGIIAAIIDPDKLRELVLSLNRREKGVFTLFDREGTLVFFSGELKAEHTNWKTKDPVLRRVMEEKRSAAGRIRYPIQQDEHFVARMPIGLLGWYAGASRPVQVAMSAIYNTLIWIAVLNAVILILSFLGAIGLSRFLIGRLDQLRAYASRIAGGDYSLKAEIRNPNELSELAASFNTMAEQIRARQASLERAVGDLTRSNQELEQFAYVASHDLQEPLRVITGFVQLIEKRYKGQLDSDADRYINFITDAVSRQQELIRDVLEFSRLGRQTLELQRIDANAAVRIAVQNIRNLIEDAKAQVTWDPLPAVMADAHQLVQVLQNLISNGIKFRGLTNPAIHVSAQLAENKWVFSVRDNGIGIEPQYWQQIFTMFKRLHTRKDYPGTGIGLAICKKIVERHGGRIWVDSKPGEGSTFFFTLMAVGE